MYLWIKTLLMNRKSALAIFIALVCLASCTKDPLKSYPPELTTIKKSLESTFNRLDSMLDASTNRLAPIIADTTAIRSELKTLYGQKPAYILEYALVSPAGIMEVIEPPTYYSMEGMNISSQAHIIKVFQTKAPVLSETFLAVEGFYAVVEVHPVMKNQQAAGALTALFYPHQMMDPVIYPLLEGQDFEIWMMEKGGTLIWDQDLPDIGRNLFTDPYYDPFPNLRVALEKIVAEDYGETTYSFFQAGTNVEVVKLAHWVTFTHHGQEWKIVHVRIE